MKYLGIISVDFDATSQLLVIYFAFVKHLKKMAIHETLHQLHVHGSVHH
jgi:hypothetical protein